MPFKPPSINPVSASIVAISPVAGRVPKANSPPTSDVEVNSAIAPSHVAVRVNEESSAKVDVTDNGVVVGQTPSVV